MRFHVSPISSNSKTGRITVTTTSADTCPPSCVFIGNGCYAAAGSLAFHWRAVSTNGRGTTDIQQHADAITAALMQQPRASRLVRLNQAGDLPGTGESVDAAALETIRAGIARAHGTGWTYTHKKTPAALRTVRASNRRGSLVINLSADSYTEALALYKKGYPVTVVTPYDAPKVQHVGTGKTQTRVIICPAQTNERTTCAACKLCAVPAASRPYIIGFRAHGVAKRKVTATVTLAELQATNKGECATV